MANWPELTGRFSKSMASAWAKILLASALSACFPATLMIWPAGDLQYEVEDQGQDDPDRERPKRRDRKVRDDAVIDIHREKRGGECQQVDQERRDARHERVVAPVS